MPRPTSRFRTFGIGVSLATMMIAGLSTWSPAQEPSPARARQAERPTKANPPVAFAHTQSDLAVDPAARLGRLPNGMTYVIYRNATPRGTASVWMRVAAGSVMEQEHQRGLAHFVEHMAFNGSRNVREGEMVKLLERDGLQFGADTNAQTSFFETVYMLNLPDAKDRIIDDALFLMRETAGNLLFDPDAIDRERGVVLGEERARSSVGSRADEAQLKQLFPGLKYPERMPIGTIDVLETAKRPAFLQFYNDFYRPEYATLIVVGDVDPDRIEAEVRRRFADWRAGPRSPAALTDFGTLALRTAPEARVFVGEGLADTISVSWTTSPSDAIETKAKDLDDGLFAIASAILNERYARAAKSADSAFVSAALERQDIAHTARLYTLNIRPKDGQDRAAFAQGMAALREFQANGPTPRELDRALSRYDRLYAERNTAARTVPTPYIASRIVKAIGTRGVLQSPAQELAEFRELKTGFTPAAIKAAVRRIPLDQASLLWRQGEQVGPFDEAAMLSAYRTEMAAPVGNFAERASGAWPYTQFGPPSAVVSRETLPGVDATRITFANGVVLTVKRTNFEDNAVHVSVQLGSGIRGLRQDQGAALFMARQVGLAAGGLGKASSDAIGEMLSGKIYGLSFTIGNTAAILNGTTTTADLPVQMQVLAAFIADPGFRPDALDRVKATLPSAFSVRRTSPDGVYALKATGDPYDDDPRFTTPTQQDALAIDNEAIKALLKDQLAHGPIDVTIVGDITPDAAIAQVGATLGALPALPPAVSVPGADRIYFPKRDLHRVYTHDGRSDQNLSVIAWPTTDFYTDPRRATALDLLAAVMTIRELEEVRERQGATYSVSVDSATSRYFPGFGFIISRATVRPEIDETYYKTVSALVEDLKRRPITADELKRARQPLIDRLRNQRNANGYWLSLLSGTIRDPRKVATAQAEERDLLSITPGDIQKMAQTYLTMSKALRIQIKPKAAISQ